MFLTGVSMARGVTMGAPLFGSPKDFIAAMSGQGMIGPLLAGLGMTPVQFQSAADFQKSITTESKMFSIYAVGIKKGYRREVRIKIHAVVDFRNAPDLNSQTALAGTPGAASANPLAPAPAGSSSAAAAAAQIAGTGGIAAANMPSTGGLVIYYRVE
jgi:general secretion pathway protein K